jgi:hypothetical protein
MVRYGLLFLGSLIVMSLQAQEIDSINVKFDRLAAEWLAVSGEMKTYEGLNFYCNDKEYHEGVNNLLVQIHHYDSVVLDWILDPANEAFEKKRDYRHTRKDITKFEKNYSVESFIENFRVFCRDRKMLEREKDEAEKDYTEYSYDGQILLIEEEVRRYLHGLDRRVLKIDDDLVRIRW